MSKGTTMVVAALGAVVMAVLMTVLVLRIASDPNVKSALVKDTFAVGDARRLAPQIGRDGPLLLQDPGGGGANLAIAHAGSDPVKGWLAVELRSPDRPFCHLNLRRVQRDFSDPCSGHFYRPTDPRLRRYPVRVVDGQVVVNVRAGASKSARS